MLSSWQKHGTTAPKYLVAMKLEKNLMKNISWKQGFSEKIDIFLEKISYKPFFKNQFIIWIRA